MENFRKNDVMNQKPTERGKLALGRHYLNKYLGVMRERFDFCLKMGEITVTFSLPWRKDIRLTIAEVMAVYAFLTKEMAVESGKMIICRT